MSILFVLNILDNFKYTQHKFFEMLIIFLCICISDFVDGYIARKINCTSKLGAKLDIFADLIFIFSSYLTLIILNMLPLWFFVFICFKFVEFLFTSVFIKKYYSISINPFVFDKWGKVTAALFFVVPGAACIFNFLLYAELNYLMNFLLYATLALGLLSSYLRIRYYLKLRSS
ncbi:CDP-alcohol phosphatidyltransferase family protein [Clostridium sp. LBM24168]